MRRFASVVVVVVCALGVAPAFGALTYPLDGQLAPAGGAFGGLRVDGVAVDDSSGQAYIAESNPGAVYVFGSSGAQLASLDGVLTPAGSFGSGETAVAVSNATGDVYVLDTTDSVVDVFNAAGGYVCQITGSATPAASECNGPAGSATPAGAFNHPEGIALDQATGEVFVLDQSNDVVDVFSATGGYLRQVSLAAIPGGGGPLTRGIAVSAFNGHLYVAGSAVYEFDASGAYVTAWTGANTPAGDFQGEVGVAADDTTGEVYVSDNARRLVDVFAASGAYIAQFGDALGEPRGMTVDQATHRVYTGNEGTVVGIFGPALVIPDVTTEAAGGVGPRSATLNGTVNPDAIQVSDCHFEYGTDTFYGQSVPCVPAPGGGSSPVAVHAAITGLEPGTTYHFRLQASDVNGTNFGSDETLATPPAPSIGGAAATNVTGSSADLNAQVNPNGFDTTYRFEWGTSTSYAASVPIPDADIGASTSAVPIATHLSGLSTNTTYHWRVVAKNVNGTTTTGDHTFIYSTGGGALPDDRAYEMVTPPDKNAALIGKIVLGVAPDVSRDGSRVILTSIQCFAGSGSCTADRYHQGEPFEFTRTATGWVTTPLAPPATRFEGNTEDKVSADAGTALFYIETPPAGEEDWWTRGSDGSFVDIGPAVPSGDFTPFYALDIAATADFSHLVWDSHPIWPFDSTTGQLPYSVYEYAGAGSSAPVLVGVNGGRGSTDLISTCGTEFGAGNGEIPGSLSADGRTVFFTSLKCASGSGVNAGVAVPANEVWARIDESRSVLLSGRSPLDCTSSACLGSPVGGAQFEGASVDGSRAFFASTQQLTDNASEDSHRGDSAVVQESATEAGCPGTVGVNGCNLYEYDSARGAGHSLVAVSAGDSSGGGPRVQGVAAVSSDGSHVYFVAQGVLSGAANSAGRFAKDGADNLYVFEQDAAHPEGHTAFITTLPATDYEVWRWIDQAEANVTPDGRFLVFTSHGALTGDDTSTSGAAQVFRYDAQTGVLTRISIGDEGFNDNGSPAGDATCLTSVCPMNASIATPEDSQAGEARLDPTMSDDGAYVFFMSPVGLTPGALDGAQIGTNRGGEPIYARNVYEYHEGRVSLISDGRDSRVYGPASDVTLIGSDVTGRNVFFTTSDPLVAQDTDTQLDVYDARVCTASEPCVASAAPVVACQGEGCRGAPPGAPVAPVAASVAFAGSGNLASPPVAAPKKKATVKKKHANVKHKRSKRPAKKPGKRGRRAVRGAHRGRGGRS